MRSARIAASLGVVTAIMAAGAGAQADSVTIGFWHCWGGFRVPVMESVVSDFMKANPDIKVDMKVEGCGDIHQKFATAAAGGVAPDVVMVNTSVLPSFVDSGLMLPLDAYLAKDNVKLSDYVPSAVSLSTVGGKVYSLPTSVPGDKNEFLFYNTDAFANAAVNAPTDISDWSKLVASAKKLTQVGSDGKVKQLALNVGSGGDFNFLAWVFNNGGQYLSSDGRKVLLGDEKGKETINWLADFQQLAGGPADVSGFLKEQGGTEKSFYGGSSAMLISGSWMFSYLAQKAPKLEYGVVQRPANVGESPQGVTLGGWSYGVAQESRHAEAAWKLVEWLTYRTDSVRAFTQGVQTVPALFGLLRDRAFWIGNPLEPYFDLVVQVVSSDRVPTILPVEDQLTKLRQTAASRALSGAVSPNQALGEAVAKMQAIVDDYWSGLQK